MAEKLAQILCLDDSPGFVDIYQQVLQECGYRTFVVTDSNEALDMLWNNKIDLFIQDFNHPMVNGAEILKIMKAD